MHICHRRVTKHLLDIQVKRFNAITLPETEMSVTCCLTYNIEWRPLTLSYFAYMFNMLFVNEQTHALLTFIGDNFLTGESLISYREFCHIYLSATFLY